MPVRDDERAALYRTTLTGRRVLILLDNAKDAAQVRSLLPGSSSCAVLVTTRNRTPDLASTRFVDLNVLEDTEALALFSRIVGEERAAAEPDATAEILVACAGLPLAIRICAARLAARRSWRIATLAGRLRNEHRRLDELRIGDLAVRASFQVSYDSLRTARQRHRPGPRVPAARPLAGDVDQPGGRRGPARRAGRRHRPTRLRRWWTSTCSSRPPPTGTASTTCSGLRHGARAGGGAGGRREEAVGRLLRWYLDTAEAAADTVSPQRYQVPLAGRPHAGSPARWLRRHGRRAGLVRRRARQRRRGDAPGGGRRPARGRLAAAADPVPAVQPAETTGRTA